MKLTKEEFQRSTEESPLELFYQGIRAQETREKYTRTLRYILCNILEEILDGDFEDRATQLVKHAKNDLEWTRDLLLNISRKLKERTQLPTNHPEYLKPTSIDNYFKPLKKLFDMNDIALPWKRIYSTFPEIDNLSRSRGWTRKEIQEMLKFAKGAIDRAIILVAASSGIRAGGYDFNWGDLTPVYRINNDLRFDITESEADVAEVACAMIIVYKGTYAEYPAFITPEAYLALMDYKKEWAREVGREPRPEDPIFKKEGPFARRASRLVIKKRIERMIKKASLRSPLKKGERRHEVPIMNGFRRFWNKACKESLSKDSPLASLIKKEYMMGHTGLIKLDKNYFQAHSLELAEEYINAVPNLTISEEEKMKAENLKLMKQKSELEKEREEKNLILKRLESVEDDLAKVKKRQRVSEKYKKVTVLDS